MTIKDMIIKSGGVWMIKYRDNYKIVVDFKNNAFDTFEFYKIYGVLENDITSEFIQNVFKNVKECKKIK